MPEILSGPRTARSFVTPGGVEVITRVLDFNFAADQGIQINAVLGNLVSDDLSPAASDTVPVRIPGSQTLHLEEGTIEDMPGATAEDADEIDTEVFFQQEVQGQFQVPATAGGGGGSGGQGALYIPYIKPILVARNITHRGETRVAGQAANCSVLIFYEYVRFSLSELGLILARRQ